MVRSWGAPFVGVLVIGNRVVRFGKSSLDGRSGQVACSLEDSLPPVGGQLEVDSLEPLIRLCHRGWRVVETDGAPPVGTTSHGRGAKGERVMGPLLGSVGLTSTAPLGLRRWVLRLVQGVQSHPMDDMWTSLPVLANVVTRLGRAMLGAGGPWGR